MLSHAALSLFRAPNEGRQAQPCPTELILAFNNHKPIDARDSFQWLLKDPLWYRLYSAPLTGSQQTHDGKSLRTIATFTVGLEPVAFANKDWYRPGSAK
jgi:hypothetical protein